jgi:hypothetical protein
VEFIRKRHLAAAFAEKNAGPKGPGELNREASRLGDVGINKDPEFRARSVETAHVEDLKTP